MGETFENQNQEITLRNYLYRDIDLINSLYSQANAGNLESITMSASHNNSVGYEVSGGIKLLEANKEHKSLSNEAVSRLLSPHDYKITELLAELPTIGEDADFHDGNFVELSGSIDLWNKQYFESILDFAMKLHMLDESFENAGISITQGVGYKISPSAAKVKGESFFQNMPSLFPGDNSLLFKTSKNQYDCLINAASFSVPPIELISRFGKRLAGTFHLIGIYYANDFDGDLKKDKAENNDNFLTLSDSPRDSLFDVMDIPQTLLNPDKKMRQVVPIVIYKELG